MSSLQLETDATSPYYGDLAISDNSISLTDGLEAIRQHLQVRLQLFLGEWFLDQSVGLPWFQDILKKQPSFVVVNDILKDAVLDTYGVLELLEFNFDYNPSTREVVLEFQALTTDGILDFTLESLNR